VLFRPLAVGGVLFVADEAVDPEVGDRDLKGVGAGAQGLADFEAERAVPEHAEVLAVEADFRDHGHLAQIEPDLAGRC
jgi:hypothetical protein